MKKLAAVVTVMAVLFYFSFSSTAEEKKELKEKHAVAEMIIGWSSDKIFFQIIDLSDETTDYIKGKISDYKEYLINEVALRSAKRNIEKEEFESYKAKISRCSDTENLIVFIKKLRSYEGNEGELAFEGSIF